MKKYLIIALIGLIFGLAMGCLEDYFAYLDSLPDPFRSHDHWYDLPLLIPAFFAMPGCALDYWTYNPPDGNYGDEWDQRIPIALFNAIFWMLTIPLAAGLISVWKRPQSI